jgi:hypothetical protein
MRFLSVVLFFNFCKKAIKARQKPIFLVGSWVRIHQPDSITIYGKWNTNLKGIGLTLKDKDTTFMKKWR